MGPAPTLSTYQQAAQAIYAPQLQSDITMAQNTEQGDIANQETSKGQINTDYQTAVQNLTDTTNANVAKINQLYTQRLGGNFSGLQGNDLGQMFSTASKNQSTIESDRANKLAAIATTEANDQDTYNATVQSLTSKYQGEEAAEANSEYNTAMNNYNSQQLSLEKSEISAASKANAPPSAASTKLSVAQQIADTLNSVTGSNGGKHAGDNYVSPKSYSQAKNAWVQAGYSAAEFDTQFSNYRNPNDNYGLPVSAATTASNALLASL